jgi:hypothetical protein
MFDGSAVCRWFFARKSESHIVNYRALDAGQEALERLR